MMNSKIQKEEKELARMRSKKMAAEVIAAQEKVVGDLKKQQEMLAKVEQSKTDGSRKDIVLTFSFVDEETLQVSEQSYKVAFVKNNRPINHKKVDGFITVIAKGKYEKAFPIIVASAKELIENGYRVVDVEGNEIDYDDNTIKDELAEQKVLLNFEANAESLDSVLKDVDARFAQSLDKTSESSSHFISDVLSQNINADEDLLEKALSKGDTQL